MMRDHNDHGVHEPVHPLLRRASSAHRSNTSPSSTYASVTPSTSDAYHSGAQTAASTSSPANNTNANANGQDSSLDANLRQLAILQALVARQQELVRASAAAAPAHEAGELPTPNSNSNHLRRASVGVATSHPEPKTSTMDHTALLQAFSTSNVPFSSTIPTSTSSSSWLDGLNALSPLDLTANSSASELAQAQQQLDLWARVPFHSQANTPIATSPQRLSIANFGSSTNEGMDLGKNPHREHQEFDWSNFYNELGGSSMTDVGESLPPSALISANATTKAQTSPPTSPQRANRARSKSASLSSSSISKLTKTRTTATASSSRSTSPPLIDESLVDELLEEKYPIRTPLTSGTPEEIEEDKRIRNTQASARFRARKKQRDALLVQTSAQLRERANDLEKEKQGLLVENQWLRDLVSERKPEMNGESAHERSNRGSGGSSKKSGKRVVAV